MAPKIIDKEVKQRAIALASVTVFGEKGFDRTRMEDVAKAAGVGKGTIYEYFKTKDELMEGAITALFADMAGELMPGMENETSICDALAALIRQGVQSIKQMGYAYRFFLEYMIHISRANKPNTFLAIVLNQYRACLSSMLKQGMETGEIRNDLDPLEAAASIAAWLDGAVFHWFTLPDTVSMEAMGEAFINMIIGGLKAPPKEDEK